MCGTAAGVGVTGVADAGARLLLFARRLRREAVRGGGVEDVDQLAMFFWYAVPGAVMNNTENLRREVAYRLYVVGLARHRTDTGTHWPHERAG